MTRAVLGAMAVLLLALPVLAFSLVPTPFRIPSATKERRVPLPEAKFSHWTHGRMQCYRCHPSIFPEKLQGFTHAQMEQGLYCGRCHDGRQSFAVKDQACETCHAAK